MPLASITSWSLSSPDATVWVPSVSSAGLVTWLSGGGVITATPPVFQGSTDATIWTPTISNSGIVTITSGAAAGQFWATLQDVNQVRWYFFVDLAGVTSIVTVERFYLDDVALYPTALSLSNIQAHYAASLTDNTYETAVLAQSPVGYWRLGDTETARAFVDAWAQRPLTFEIDGISWTQNIKADSFSLNDTVGEQMTCDFQIVNPETIPVVGQPVQIRYYEYILFGGTIDRIECATNNTLTYRAYTCACTGWAQILIRRRVVRNFTNMSVRGIVDSLVDNELAGEGLLIGVIDQDVQVAVLDSRGSTVMEVMRNLASLTGQTCYVDTLRTIHFRATSGNAAPLDLDPSTVEIATTVMDRETYRNVETVIVSGTPADGEDAVEVSRTEENTEQIAARAAIEGGTGRYESVDHVTHPLSNNFVDLSNMAISYVHLYLAVSGTPRIVLRCQARSYGFQAGQFVTVYLARYNISGTWLIQHLTITEEGGRRLVHQVELVETSLQLRAYDAWLKIVDTGKVVMALPGPSGAAGTGGTTSQTITFASSTTWTVPAGVQFVEFTCVGGSGGGGGGVAPIPGATHVPPPPGGAGGASGKAITSREVVEGEIYIITVGAEGSGGVTATSTTVPVSGTRGTNGVASLVTLSAAVLCRGDGSTGGTGGVIHHILKLAITTPTYTVGANGTNGGGFGIHVYPGGGRAGGAGGTGAPVVNGFAGLRGYVTIRY